jgi:prepilin-type N-terminal cleavage/methylation domain-containing protein
MQNPLSSNLAFAVLFSLSLPARAQYHALLTTKSMAKSSPPSVEHAFTLIELLVVIAGIGILLGIAVPALNSAYERVKVTKDMSNLRQIGLGVQLYLNDKDGVLPVINAAPGIGTNASPVICPKYIATKKVFQSPFDKRGDSEGDDAPVSYGINQNIYDLIGVLKCAGRACRPRQIRSV